MHLRGGVTPPHLFMERLISVVIVNYNGARWLDSCLSSLTAQTFAPFEIIFVDNASIDDSCSIVAKRFPQVKIIHSETNVGFAAGNNLGIRAAQGEAIATLNTDARVEPNYLEQLAIPLQSQRVGACAPLMLEMEHPELVDAAGLRVDGLGFAWNIGAGQRAELFQTAGTVYGACAGAALYRRAMLDEIGLFDENYFAFYEDADLAWRAHNARWETIFVPSARVYHQHGASFGKIAPRKTYLLARNRWWTLFKDEPMLSLIIRLPLIALLDVGSLLRSARRGHFTEAWQGRVDALRWRKMILSKRNNLPSSLTRTRGG